jgi:hypothetical protein
LIYIYINSRKADRDITVLKLTYLVLVGYLILIYSKVLSVFEPKQHSVNLLNDNDNDSDCAFKISNKSMNTKGINDRTKESINGYRAPQRGQ